MWLFSCSFLLVLQLYYNLNQPGFQPRERDYAYVGSFYAFAILFVFGDNEAYPLWYAQEVEGIRPDVRVLIYTLLNSDWAINQLQYKINKSDPVDVIWTADQIKGHKRDYVRYQPIPGISENQYYDLYDLLKNYVGSDDNSKMIPAGNEEWINTFPVRKVAIPVNKELVMQNGTVNNSDSTLNELRFEIPKDVLMKNDLAV